MITKQKKFIHTVALALLLGGCATSPHDPSAMLRIAQSMEHMDKNTEALDIYTQLLTKEPDNDTAFTKALTLARKLGRREDVVSLLKLRTQNKPNDTESLNGLGQACLALGQIECAKESYDKALEEEKDNFSAQLGRSVVDDLSGRHNDAQVRYQALLAQFPNRHELYANYGLSLALSGKASQGLPYLKRAAEDQNATNRDRANYATALALAGHEKQAKELFKREVGQEKAEENINALRAFAISDRSVQPLNSEEKETKNLESLTNFHVEEHPVIRPLKTEALTPLSPAPVGKPIQQQNLQKTITKPTVTQSSGKHTSHAKNSAKTLKPLPKKPQPKKISPKAQPKQNDKEPPATAELIST